MGRMMILTQMNKWLWLLYNSSAFPESPELNTTLGLLYIQTANHQVAKKYHQRYMEVAPRYMLLTLLTLILLLTWFRKIKLFDNLFHDLPKTSLKSWRFLFTGGIWAPGNSAGFWAKELESNPCCWKHDAVPPGDHVGDDDGDDGGVSSSDHGNVKCSYLPN